MDSIVTNNSEELLVARPTQDHHVAERPALQTHFRDLLDLYKHHFDLYVKSYAVYVALIETITGIAFADKVPLQGARWLLFFCFLGSLFVVVSSRITQIWIHELTEDLADLSGRIGLKAPRMSGPRRTVMLLTTLALTFAMGSAVLFMVKSSAVEAAVAVTSEKCAEVSH